MNILITGASGLIGQALTRSLTQQGHNVSALSRQEQASPPFWTDDEIALPDTPYDAVVHLAGEPIGDARWSDEKKRKIIESRVKGTRLLVDALRKNPPNVLVSASAIGFYGDRGEELLDEHSDTGTDFVSEVARVWEAEADNASDFTRVVKIRTGLVLAKSGGALAQMLPFFKMGIGGKVGSGKQYWSWISLNDEVRAIAFLINASEQSGVFNLVSPIPAENSAFTKALGDVLNRPTFFTVPEFLAKLQFGEMAEELLLGSTRVVPTRLLEAGFVFEDRDLVEALRRSIE